MELKRVSLIGLGALGLLFGWPMAQALGPEGFAVIAEEARSRRYEAEGVTVNGAPCRFAYVTPAAARPADLVIVAVKATGLEQAMRDLAGAVGPDTVILSLLNGISSEELLSARWPGQVVWSVSIHMDATRTGRRLRYEQMGRIQLGEPNGSHSPRLAALAALFDRCGVPYELCDDILKKQWNKLMINVGLNQAAAVYDLDYGGLCRSPEAGRQMRAAMQEVVELSQREGVCLPQDAVEQWWPMLARFAPQGMPSMRQDVLAHRPTEKELFSGTVRRLARAYGLPTPANDFFYERLCAIEAGYAPVGCAEQIV